MVTSQYSTYRKEKKDNRRFKIIMATLVTLAILGVGATGFLCYNLGYTFAKVEGEIAVKNTEEALSSHYDSELEALDNRALGLLDTNMQLRNQLNSTLELGHILLTYPQEMFNVSAYTADGGDKPRNHPEYGITASGEMVVEWYTAAAPQSIPFGTVLYIPYFKDKPNKGIFVVKDRGGAMVEGHLDIFMPNLEDAFAFGRQELEVYVLR